MKIDLSIIVPIYNVEIYLEQAVNSLLNQKNFEYEVILVDDGSTDKCPEICEKFSKNERVRVIHKTNGGLVSARKAGVVEAKGKYITFLDGDDWIEPDYYFNMIQIIKKNEVDLVCSGYIHDFVFKNIQIPYDNKAQSGKYYGGTFDNLKKNIFYAPPFFNFGMIPTVWSKVFKKEILVKHLLTIPDDITMGEDVVCSIPYLINSEAIYVMNDNKGYHYRYVDNSMSNEYSIKRVVQIKKAIDYLFELAELNIIPSNVLDSLDYYVLFMTKEVIKNCSSSKKAIIDLQEFCSNERIRQALGKKKNISFGYKLLYKLLYKQMWRTAMMYYKFVSILRG